MSATQQQKGAAGSPTATGLSVVRVALSGPRGCFADAASRQLLHSPIELVPCTGFDEALTAVQQGRADAAVLPRENTLIGTIMPALDAVLDRSMRIVAETVLRVEHHLITVPGGTLDEIRHVYSHPQRWRSARNSCAPIPRGSDTPSRTPRPPCATS